MSTPSHGPREAARPAAARTTPTAGAATKPAQGRHAAGGVTLGKEVGHEAQRWAALILDVLAGVRTPRQAAEALAVSVPRYYQMETRALQALVAGCEARPRGPGRSAEKELAALRRRQQRLEGELNRQQTLLRLAQRAIGLAPAKPPAGKEKGKQRRRRPVVRALRAAETLQRHSQQTQAAEAPETAAAMAPNHEPG